MPDVKETDTPVFAVLVNASNASSISSAVVEPAQTISSVKIPSNANLNLSLLVALLNVKSWISFVDAGLEPSLKSN